MREQIRDLVISIVTQAIEGLGDSGKNSLVEESMTLFGQDAHVDSLTLVNIIVDLEEVIQDQLNRTISLTDDEAVFKEPSPFSSVGLLIDYIESLLIEDN